MHKRKKPQLRLVVDNESVLISARLNGHLLHPELATTKDLYLVRPQIRDDPVPHGHGLPGATKSISKGLMGATEMVDDILKFDASAQVKSLLPTSSVSMLPPTVKQLTRRSKGGLRKLAYMSKRGPKDPWSVQRGKKMRDARKTLGYSQEDVAKLLELPDDRRPSRESISQYESGDIKEIDPPLVPQFARILGLTLSDLSRIVTNSKDDGADLRISTLARSIAYKFDRFPEMLQMQIRQVISVYEISAALEKAKKPLKKSAKG